MEPKRQDSPMRSSQGHDREEAQRSKDRRGDQPSNDGKDPPHQSLPPTSVLKFSVVWIGVSSPVFASMSNT